MTRLGARVGDPTQQTSSHLSRPRTSLLTLSLLMLVVSTFTLSCSNSSQASGTSGLDDFLNPVDSGGFRRIKYQFDGEDNVTSLQNHGVISAWVASTNASMAPSSPSLAATANAVTLSIDQLSHELPPNRRGKGPLMVVVRMSCDRDR